MVSFLVILSVDSCDVLVLSTSLLLLGLLPRVVVFVDARCQKVTTLSGQSGQDLAWLGLSSELCEVFQLSKRVLALCVAVVEGLAEQGDIDSLEVSILSRAGRETLDDPRVLL